MMIADQTHSPQLNALTRFFNHSNNRYCRRLNRRFNRSGRSLLACHLLTLLQLHNNNNNNSRITHTILVHFKHK